MKRYSIVRVDGHCPNRFEDVLNENVCKVDKNGECYSRCSESRYGDTKEQLIRKIAQVFSMEKIIVAKTLDEYKYKLAKEIVEFLGVE